MEKGLHFISGLPRSGSTLLAGILRQNPRLHTGMSTPVARLFTHLLIGMGAHQENAIFIEDEQREAILRSLFESYYHKLHREKLVFDTNRMWCSRMPALARLFPEARVIACVRDLSWILDSFERLARRNPFWVARIFQSEASAMPANTVYSRIEALTSPNGTVGFAFNALQEAFYGEYASRLMIIDYNSLAREPTRTLAALYDFLELPPFDHDFDNVAYDASEEFDTWLGLPGMHKVAKKVQYVKRESILPPDLFQRFGNRDFWNQASRSGTHGGPLVLSHPDAHLAFGRKKPAAARTG